MNPAEHEQQRTFLLSQPGPIANTPEALDAELARLDADATASRRTAREAGAERPAVEEAGYHRRRAWVLVRLAEHRGERWHALADTAVTAWHAAEAEAWLSTQRHTDE